MLSDMKGVYSTIFLFSFLFLFSIAGAATSSSTQDKIDQLFIIGFRGADIEHAPEVVRALSETNVGGVILFDYDTPSKQYDRNIKTTEQVTTLIRELQSSARTPLFISIDEESGKVSRLKSIPGFVPTPSAVSLAMKSDSAVVQVGQTLGMTLAKLGFNLDFAPILDVNVNKKSPAIGAVGRSFSHLQSVVARKGLAFATGLTSARVVPVVKHYPGHGSATGDTHKGFVDITRTFRQYELFPFFRACAIGVPMVMVGHLYDARVDKSYPASLSSVHIDRLRSTLGCKTQVLITDDIDMKALTDQYSRRDVLVHAFTAGIDMVIASNNITMYTPDEFFTDRALVLDAVQKEEIPEARIDDAYARVMKLKKEFGIVK